MSEIVTRSSDQAGPVVTAAGLADQIREFSRQFNWDAPRPARLVAGSWVIRLLREMAATSIRAPWHPPALPTLFAVPIVPSDDGDPFRWRLIGTDGEVMQEGKVPPPVVEP